MMEAAGLLRARSPLRPTVGIVLGSAQGALADSLKSATRIPYSDIPGLPVSTAIGHKGELVLGTIGDTPIAVMSGRFHLYEGYSAQQVASGIRMFRALGISRVVLTNAAGGINLE
jgi:purine-nucleoside phosphorylase